MSLCDQDSEFKMASRHWSGGLRLIIGNQKLELFLEKGEIVSANYSPERVIEISGEADVWSRLLAARPARFNNDIIANLSMRGGLSRKADKVVFAQYYSALMRSIELLRGETAENNIMGYETKETHVIEDVRGSYMRLPIGGHNFRIYYEEVGDGIPVMLQHTAGSHGSQWRHLYENREITQRFRLITYDLPFHGKSLPPPAQKWWEQPYKLNGAFLRSVPLQLSEALMLDRPVFMGCSIGGLLALDLALNHPEEFRAVISLEGSLKVDGSVRNFSELDHPQVNGQYKGRLMEGMTSPDSPKAYRKEIAYMYSGGWDPLFLGDLQYYTEEFDLTRDASRIDTNKIAVHILSGEYDWSSPVESGRDAHKMIPGSTWSEMRGIGHFPMSENPKLFFSYLMPILESIIQESRKESE
tara:strand:- start:1274 stop:2512 length:1239 start_codon:yes stop_codon:yes gene_type:complete